MEFMNNKNQLLPLLLILISVASLNVKTMAAANPSPSASSPSGEPPLSLLNPIPINYFDPPRRSPSSSGPSSVAISHVKSVCNKTMDPSLCVSVILPHLNGKSRTDPTGILTTCIDVSTRGFQLAVEQLKALSGGPNPPSSRCYERCLKNYEEALEYFKDALEKFQAGTDQKPMPGSIMVGFHHVTACEDDFLDSPGTDGLIAQSAGSLKNVSGICNDIEQIYFNEIYYN